MAAEPQAAGVTTAQKWLVLGFGFFGWLFAGAQLGLMPFAALTISRDLMGAAFTPSGAGSWFAAYTAVTMLGAASGGILFGHFGDRYGRARGLAVSMLFFTCFGLAGGFVRSQEQLILLRFLTGLGVGGTWPNGVSLLSEFWADVSRPAIAGLMGAGANLGILLLSLLGRLHPVTPETWRVFMFAAGAPVVVAVAALLLLPESPKWLQSRLDAGGGGAAGAPLRELFSTPLLRTTLLGVCLGGIPLLGAWASSKWMLPWADQVAGPDNPGYKATAMLCWSVGATLGGLAGGWVGQTLGRRLSYALISIGACAMNLLIFGLLKPLEPLFLPAVLVQGMVSTLFFGWLPLYLPEIFPTRVRATGTGISYNSGRFLTAGGVLAAGMLIRWFDGDYARVGSITGLIYALGVVVILLAPETKGQSLRG